MWHHLTNTQYFSEAALQFKKNGGRYTMAPRGSREYFEYWALQEKRCKEGYKVGDVWITGRHYFYLNFTIMQRLKEGGNAKTGQKITDFPRFTEMQYEWWRFKHIAWNGGTFMGINSPGGKHICCGKTRRAGFSYMEAADGFYNYTFIDGSKSFYFASREDYLTKDGILNKVNDNIDWINTHSTKWMKNRHEKSTLLHQRATFRDESGNIRGSKSEIMGVIVDDPNKTRGKSGMKITFEEAGSFKKLKQALEISMGSIIDGARYVGQATIFGCVCAGTEVYKANGEKVLIENLKQEDGILGYNGRGISKEPITYMQAPAKKDCVEITLETGIKLRCSIDHPILSTHSSWKASHQKDHRRKVSFIEAQNLTTEHQVAVIESVPFFGTTEVKEAYTLGFLIGDGYYGGTIECIVDNEASLALIEKDCTKIELKREYSVTLASYSIGGNIRQLLKSNGMWGQSKKRKRFPTNWREYSKESLAKLLAGYFDADGNIKIKDDKYVSLVYSSIVLELVRDVQEALLKFGIHSTITEELCKGGYTDSHIIHRLYINRVHSVLLFREHIPIVHTAKTIPTPSAKLIQLLQDAKDYKENVFSKEVPLTHAQLYKVKSVVSIGEQYIYNLTAGTTHTYLANNIITHNTGGEEGASLEGLEDIFYDPHKWNMLEFPNVWESGETSTCGYFVPCYRTNLDFIDKDGNSDEIGAIAFDETQRELKRGSKDPRDLDRRKAEFPQIPSEMFNRLTNNGFNIHEIDQQIKRVLSSSQIQGLLRYGMFTRSNRERSLGGVEFLPEIKEVAKPIELYPHPQSTGYDLSGCVTIVEPPYIDQNGKVPPGMYQIVFDAYYKDDAEDKTSLFDFRVFKLDNSTDSSSYNLPVAWFTGRPARLSTCHEQLFMMCDYYNCTAQGELGGGGQGVVDYAKQKKLLHRVEFEPEMLHNKEIASKQKNRSYLMNMTTDRKRLGMTYLEQWHMEQRGVDDNMQPIYNVHRIYDIGLLRELRRGGISNSDRMSACLIAMFMLKENVAKTVKASKTKNSFYERTLFAAESNSQEYTSLY